MAKRRNHPSPPPAPPPARATRATTGPLPPWVVPAVLAVLVIVVFASLRTHEFVNFDDPIYVTNNQVVQRGLTPDGIAWAFRSLDFNWHPVTWLSHMLDVELFGLDAGKHHLVSVVFHLANTLLVFFLLRTLTGSEVRSGIVAALFGVHPLHVESVAWLAERKDVLSAFFALLTLWMYADYARSRSKAKYVLALLFFILGLMSKGMLVTIPFVMLLLDWWPLKRLDRHALAEKIPFFALIVPSIGVTIAAQKAVGAIAVEHSFGNRVANAIVSYGAYLWKTVWPAGLAIPYPWRTSIEPMHVAVAGLVVVAISAAAFVYRRERPALFTGWFWFVGMLVPVIGVVQIGSQSMADRYTYLPHIGLFVAVVWLVAESVSAEARQLATLAAMAVVGIFAFVAHRQAAVWQDSTTLFSHAVAVTRNNAVAHMNLGTALQDSGDPNGALAQFEAAVAADPGSADALTKLARVKMQFGRNDEAAGHLQKALSLKNTDENAALLAIARGDARAAAAAYAKAVAAEPASASLRNDYAAALAREGRDDDAIAQYREAIRLSPTLYDAHMNLGAILARLGKNADARAEFDAAAAIRPRSPEPHVYLALINANTGRLDLALMSAQAALAIDPVQANAQFTNAVRMPFKETNFQEFIALLQSKQQQPPPQ